MARKLTPVLKAIKKRSQKAFSGTRFSKPTDRRLTRSFSLLRETSTLKGLAPSRPVFHLIYSTNWVFKGKVDTSLPPDLQEASRLINARQPLCCELTTPYFCELLSRIAHEKGFEVVRWPVRGRSAWLAVGQAARSGRMVTGVAAVLMHSWNGDYEKECVPAWEFYPVLGAIKARHELLYPSPCLDRLHSEKRYTSALMPPTQHLRFIRRPKNKLGWVVKGHGQEPLTRIVAHSLALLRKQATEADLSFEYVIVKQGLSWGGSAVTRLAPGDVASYIKQRVLPKMRPQIKEITLLLQANLDVISELRWVILNGELRGRGWKTLHPPKPGRPYVTGGYMSEAQSRQALADCGLAKDVASLHALEESMRSKVEQVFAEAVSDAGGEIPQYLRVDLLLDRRGRAWLGERESWGADLMENPEKPRGRTNPSKIEVASAIVARAANFVSHALPGKV